MRSNQKPLRLNRETIRELDAELKKVVAGRVQSIPPTICACTGTETYTNICCIAN